MKKSDWNPQQKNAIDAKNRSIIVSAAAGSGKTSVLIEKLKNIIADTENKVNVEDMIVVTFTTAAAAEMKQRLSMAIEEKLKTSPSDNWLKRQQAFLGSASISTIHSFCFQLIRENTAGLPFGSDFRVLEESEYRLMKATVLKEYIDNLYETAPDDTKTLRDTFCGNNDNELVDIILKLHNNITAIPFYENWFEKCYNFYNDTAANQKKYADILENQLFIQRNNFLPLISAATELGDSALADQLRNEDISIIDKSISVLKNSGIKELADFLESPASKQNSAVTTPFGKKSVPSPELTEEYALKDKNRKKILAKRSKIFEKLRELAECKVLLDNVQNDCDLHKKIMKLLEKTIIEFDELLYKEKAERNALSFDDAECIALNLLAQCDSNGNITKTALGQELSENYALIMVDEYQDSNDRQDMIFRLLSKEGSPYEYGKNLFFVGDVKQSIYRFRQANPDNFIKVMETFKPYKEDDDQNACINLSCNYRSSEQVIDFVNFIFRNIMTKEAGDINYTKKEYLVKGAAFPPYDRTATVMMIDKKNNDENAEPLYIAKKINSMIKEKVQVFDAKSQKTRDCEPKDFCILMRNKNLNAVYEEALNKYGLNVNCENVSGYLNSKEIAVLLNILRVVDNPMQDIPLTSVLMSPMFAITADEISMIRLVTEKTKLYNNIAVILDSYDKKPEDEDNIEYREEKDSDTHKKIYPKPDLSAFPEDSAVYIKLLKFYATLSDLRLAATVSTLPELIQMIYDRTDFTSVISIYRDAERKRANLRVLLEYANSFEKTSSGGVGGFIRYIDKIIESKGDFESVSIDSSSMNAVSIKTMHKSKGLEYPFVFVAETTVKFVDKDSKTRHQFATDIAVAFKFQNKEKFQCYKTIPHEIIKNFNRTQQLGEEMRLLYVALTRAKERLFITTDISEKAAQKASTFAGNIGNSQGITPQLVLSAESMNDWLLMNLISHSDSDKLCEKLNIAPSFRYSDNFPIIFEEAEIPTVKETEEIIDVPEKNNDTSNPNEQNDLIEACDSLHKMFSSKYDNRLTQVVSKLSVSDISHKNTEDFVSLKKPKFKDEDLSGAQRGTAIHTFLQFAEFKNLEKDFEAEKERVIQQGHITKKQGTAIKKEDIDAFLSSTLYSEIKDAQDVLREEKFLIKLDELGLEGEAYQEYKETDAMLNGIMDMVIVKKNGHLLLVDYKTDTVNNVEQLVHMYHEQLLLYKKALEKIHNKTVDAALIYSFCKRTAITVD